MSLSFIKTEIFSFVDYVTAVMKTKVQRSKRTFFFLTFYCESVGFSCHWWRLQNWQIYWGKKDRTPPSLQPTTPLAASAGRTWLCSKVSPADADSPRHALTQHCTKEDKSVRQQKKTFDTFEILLLRGWQVTLMSWEPSCCTTSVMASSSTEDWSEELPTCWRRYRATTCKLCLWVHFRLHFSS